MNILQTKHFLLPLVIISLVFSACETASKVATTEPLKFNLEKGKKYQYVMDIEMTQEMGGSKTDMKTNSEYLLSVSNVEGNVSTVDVVIGDTRSTMDLMGMKIDTDTRQPQPVSNEENMLAGMMSKLFHGMKNQKMVMKVTDEGKVLEIKGFEFVKSSVMSVIDMPEEMKKEFEVLFEQFYNEETLKKQFEPFFFIFPSKKVAVGDNWKKSYIVNGISTEHSFTTKGIEGGFTTLDVKTEINGKEPFEIKGNISGTSVIETRSGLIINCELAGQTNSGGSIMHIKSKVKGTAL